MRDEIPGENRETQAGDNTDYEEHWGHRKLLSAHPCHLVRHLTKQDQSWGFVGR